MIEFYTIDSRVRIEKQKLIIQILKDEPVQKYWFHSFVLIAYLIAYQTEEALNGKLYKWVIVVAGLAWIYPHLVKIFNILFIDKWGNTINLDQVVEVTPPIQVNELETKVAVKVSSGRRREFIFRTAENAADDFVRTIREFGATRTSPANSYH